MKLLIVLLVGVTFIVYMGKNKPLQNMPTSKPSIQTSSSNTNNMFGGRYGPGGELILTKQDLEYINEEIDNKFFNKDYTDIRLSDGTVVPLVFTDKGTICPRTGLPEMNIRMKGGFIPRESITTR